MTILDKQASQLKNINTFLERLLLEWIKEDFHRSIDVLEEKLSGIRSKFTTACNKSLETLLEQGDIEMSWPYILFLFLADTSLILECLDSFIWFFDLLILGCSSLSGSSKLVIFLLFAPHWEMTSTCHVVPW